MATTKIWTPIKYNKCIHGGLKPGIKNVLDDDACKIICEKTTGCLSIDYNPSKRFCALNNADTSSVALNICEGYVYTEPSRGKHEFQFYEFQLVVNKISILLLKF